MACLAQSMWTEPATKQHRLMLDYDLQLLRISRHYLMTAVEVTALDDDVLSVFQRCLKILWNVVTPPFVNYVKRKKE